MQTNQNGVTYFRTDGGGYVLLFEGEMIALKPNQLNDVEEIDGLTFYNILNG